MDVCKPKKLWGLGVHDLRLVNLALLGKCRQCLLSGASVIWRDILTYRYGVTSMTYIMGGRVGYLRSASS